ncbi:MAG: hypothetical protein ACLTSO_10770 [Coprococcus sp.]
MMTYPELKIGDLTVKKPIIQSGMGIGISLSELWQWRKPEASV